jgi:DNA gyrase subunit A
VTDADEIMLITTKGQMVRTRVNEVRETSRNTMGVKLIDLKDGEKLQGVAPVVRDEDEEGTTTTEPNANAGEVAPE